MTYVDRTGRLLRGTFRYHLTADSREELHAFAARVGARRCWYHLSRRGVPHYDVTWTQRVLALALGAVPGTRTSRGVRLDVSDAVLAAVANDVRPAAARLADYDDALDFDLIRLLHPERPNPEGDLR
jgi:hypothetical protein